MRYTIIICAFNASKRIEATLRHIADLDYLSNQVEVILVDNASTDETYSFALSVWNSLGCSMKYTMLRESNPGKSFALWKGIKSSSGDYILVCDDDNWLNKDYLKIADQTFHDLGSDVVLGGASIPSVEMDWKNLPPFFFSYGGRYLALGSLSLNLEDVTCSKGWLMGAGCIFPKQAINDLMSVGFQQTLTCRKGDTLSTGGDVEMCYALTLIGWRLYSQPLLQFRHFIPERRISIKYLSEFLYENDKADQILMPYIRLRQLLCHKRRYRRFNSAMVYFFRSPTYLNLEVLRFSVFGKIGSYKMLPVHMIKVAQLV